METGNPMRRWLTRMVKLVSSGFKWEILPQYIQWSAIKDDTQCPYTAHTCALTHTWKHSRKHAYHTHMHAIKKKNKYSTSLYICGKIYPLHTHSKTTKMHSSVPKTPKPVMKVSDIIYFINKVFLVMYNAYTLLAETCVLFTSRP